MRWIVAVVETEWMEGHTVLVAAETLVLIQMMIDPERAIDDDEYYYYH